MCGIAGVLGRQEAGSLERMAAAIRHRGPDDSGIWMDPGAGVGLAHTRLSILDLSPAGHQPMLSSGGHLALVFNGEIYNHLELREKLAREAGGELAWRGHSDTETLLAGFETWGVEKTVRQCVGMFAFAVWDRGERLLTLGRDRLGEKPLYYGRNSGAFFFASDPKALKAHPGFRPEIDQGALADYLRYGYVPAPQSIYLGIHKLPPGSLLTVSPQSPEVPEPQRYWSLARVAEAGRRSPFSGSEAEALACLEGHLTTSVKGQKLSDVPLGAFLSGGTDSSLITAILQANSPQPVHSFTIGFEEKSHNEADQARAVAKVLGTSHNELFLTPANVCELIPSLASIHGEPFCDPSQLPTLLLSRFARQSVTVSLSGDGGDELFCGYERYRIFERISRFPGPLRSLSAALLAAPSAGSWDKIAALVNRGLGTGRITMAGDKAHKTAGILRSKSMDSMYLNFLSIWREPEKISPHALSSNFLQGLHDLKNLPDLRSRLMAFDGLTYLPDDVLCKVDRAAMAVSLETRVPLLDHRLVEFAWTLPLSMNCQGNSGKQLLRNLLLKFLPEDLVNRPKKGFAVPIATWLRGPLRDWAEALLDEKNLEAAGLVNAKVVRAKWAQHLAGERNWHYQLWNILMLHGWFEEQK
ncbi:MAG: asparagine synthase (glutamine-hydrolyzing) [Terrimicrobiaceae bacterium]